MARNTVPLNQVINDFILSFAEDDFAANASDNQIRTYALRGVRDMGFDVSKKIRSLKLAINSANNTVELPDDYVDWSKIGVVGTDGLVYVLGENKNINYSQAYDTGAGVKAPTSATANDSDNDGVYDRLDDKTANGGVGIQSGFNSTIFRDYYYGAQNAVYGAGGGRYRGEFRVNLDQNRIEISPMSGVGEVVIEYVADEARSKNPSIHVYLEEALMAYMYYRIIERKSSVPANEKARARTEYYNELRKGNARMKSFTKEEALKTIRKNFKQSPKF
jgi:hypothetical protein